MVHLGSVTRTAIHGGVSLLLMVSALVVPAAAATDVRLGEAAFAWSQGDMHRAVRLLESLDRDATVDAKDLARGRFLLAAAYRQLRNMAGQRELLQGPVVSEDPFALWWAAERLLWLRDRDDSLASLGRDAGQIEGSELLVLGALLREGRGEEARRLVDGRLEGVTEAQRHYLEALALEAAGADPAPALEKSIRSGNGSQDAEIVGAAALRRARLEARGGGDPLPWLEQVPEGGPYFGWSLHLRAMIALENEDPITARALWTDMLSRFAHHPARRDAAAGAGGLALERWDGEEAWLWYTQLEADWNAEHVRLNSLLTHEDLAQQWSRWVGSPGGSDFYLDSFSLETALAEFAEKTLDLRGKPDGDDVPALDLRLSLEQGAPMPRPSEEAIARVSEWTVRAEEMEYMGARALSELTQERRRLQRIQDYLSEGLSHVSQMDRDLITITEIANVLLADIEAALARLDQVREAQILKLAQRAADLTRRLEENALWLDWMQRMHVEGPANPRARPIPAEVPTPGELVGGEDTLATELDSLITLVQERGPELIRQSSQEVWTPRFLTALQQIPQLLTQQGDGLASLRQSLDQSFALAETSPLLEQLAQRSQRFAMAADSLRTTRVAFQDSVMRDATAVAVAQLDHEREGLDYGLAAAAFQRSVARRGEVTGERNQLPTAVRGESIERLTAFLANHPQSHARGEVRFRLADERLHHAKMEFQEKMRSFLGEGGLEAGEDQAAMVPFVDYEPAIELYRDILREDTDFGHRDAVLYSLGMILADQEDPQAENLLAELVRDFPESEFAQESWLRLGDLAFEDERFSRAAPAYDAAAEGPAPDLMAIAMYKLGWSHLNLQNHRDAIDAFRRVLDLHASGSDLARSVDLVAEAEDHLLQSLARAGGAPTFVAYFDEIGQRSYEDRLLLKLGELLRGLGLYGEALQADAAFVERFPMHPDALMAAMRHVETLERDDRLEEAHAARLQWSSRFFTESEWFSVNASDSLRTAADDFARTSLQTVALVHHHAAREGGAPQDWRQSRDLYEQLIQRWPSHEEVSRWHLHAGEVALAQEDFDGAAVHYGKAATDANADFRRDAAWQRAVALDTWYEQTRTPAADGTPGPGEEAVAERWFWAAHDYLRDHPQQADGADLLWRGGHMALTHGWDDRALSQFETMMQRYPGDERAPKAARLRADVWYRGERFDVAADGYQQALDLAQSAGQDSLVATMTEMVPHCTYRHAESLDENGGDRREAAAVFLKVATRWPTYEHADLALYRAGLAYTAEEDHAAARDAFARVLQSYPESSYRRDAQMQTAAGWLASDRPREAAAAYRQFAIDFPEDEDAADALLRSGELLESAGDVAGADAARDDYMERFPGDVDTAMAILHERAENALSQWAEGEEPPAPGSGEDETDRRRRDLARYLQKAQAHPELASKPLLAHVAFLRGEALYPRYQGQRLTQPLAASIEARKATLETLLAHYRECGEIGVAQWSRASAYRIGQALVDFGEALRQSERPAELSGDDLLAYDEVLEDQAFTFFDRGEETWSQLLRQTKEVEEDTGEWIARTRSSLWPRLAQRFLHYPELDHPRVEATPPPPPGDSTAAR